MKGLVMPNTWLRRLLMGAVVLAALSGCVADNLPMDNDFGPDRSLIYGYIDMSSASVPMDAAVLAQVEPETDHPYYDFTVRKGVIYASNIPPGKYVPWQFGGGNVGTFTVHAYSYQFPFEKIRQLRVNTHKPGLYYIGSWKFVRTGKGAEKSQKFKFIPSNKMNEKKILERLLTEANNPKWKKLIEKRIAQL